MTSAGPPPSAAAAGRACTVGCGGCALGLLLLAGVAWSGRPAVAIMLLAAAGGALALGVYGNLLAQRRDTLDAALAVPGEPFRFGGKVHVTATITAKRDCPLGDGYLALRCLEQAIDRNGKSPTTYTHTAYEERTALSCNTTLPPGATWQASAEFRLPEGWPASFQGRNNTILWQVHLELAVPGPRLDVRLDQDVAVLPELA